MNLTLLLINLGLAYVCFFAGMYCERVRARMRARSARASNV